MADNKDYPNQRSDYRQNNSQRSDYRPNSGPRPSYGQTGGPRSGYGQTGSAPQTPAEILPRSFPEDYVDAAEKVMKLLARSITTSKLRNLYSFVSDIYSTENLRNAPQLLPESQTALSMMRIRTAYEAGRDSSVKDFVTKARVLDYIKEIGTDREKLIRFAHYMEALVAYHRYYGGREG